MLHPNPEEQSLLRMIRPLYVVDYASNKGWEKAASDVRDYTRLNHSERDLVQLIIPKRPEDADYTRRMRRVIERLSEVEARPVIDILRDIIRYNSDCLHFRQVSITSKTGAIYLRDGIRLLNGISRALESSACGVIDPQPYYKRLHRSQAKQFLDACMLEQTGFGSFIMNVSCPLKELGAEDSDQLHFENIQNIPLVRRIVQYAILAADKIVRAIESCEVGKLVDEIGSQSNNGQQNAPLVNANFCDAILEVCTLSEESELHLSASWAPSLPLTISLPSAVCIRPEYLEHFEKLSRQIRPSDADVKQVSLIATVEELAGDLGDSGRREGDVKLLVFDQDNDELSSATVSLNADNYVVADRAHMTGSYVRVIGTFRRGPRKHNLTDIQSFSLLDIAESHLTYHG